ncbi:MAG: phosphate ABC transporter substrate-binding protein PstS [Phycisphaerales bacterium]|nr:phosphate ABC transporter substrate-binding protein PstS [Phycisphaerales bacterium]
MRRWIAGVAAAAAMVLGTGPIAAGAGVRLTGAGATFPQPLYEAWVAEFNRTHPDVAIDYQPIGSGGGIKSITDKTVHFAGSDAPMTRKEQDGAGGAANLVQIPSVAGAVVPAYNLPGVEKPLNFTGPILADIYLGRITQWNDPRLVEINPGVALPDRVISPVYRSDGSGTTFVFTSYLAGQSEEFSSAVGSGKSVSWPVGQAGKGNTGVAQLVQATAGSIGYIEHNFASANAIAYGAVKNAAGKFVRATTESVSSAGSGAAERFTGTVLAADIWNQAGDGAYPISAFTYLIVYKDLSNLPSREHAQAMVMFLRWAVSDGQAAAAKRDYAPLAAPVRARVVSALDQLTYKGEPLGPSKK